MKGGPWKIAMRHVLRALLALGLVVTSSMAARAVDLAALQPAETRALQKRLTDDGCYKGAIDGQASQTTSDAMAACPDQDPVLRIEAGVHLSEIPTLAADAACRLVATGSYDKTVRLWSMPDGKLIRTVRLPIGSGVRGKIYAVALTRDGNTLAAGGSNDAKEKGRSNGLYLIDLPSGHVRRLGPFDSSVDRIAFSPDDKSIAVITGGMIKVLETSSGREVMTDEAYGDHASYLAWGVDGSLFMSAWDGLVRRYAPDLTLAAKARVAGEKSPDGVTIDPTGRRLAVGDESHNNPVVRILDASTLRVISKPGTEDLKDGDFFSVRWFDDGRQLVAAGSMQERFPGLGWRFVMRRFNSKGAWIRPDIPAALGTIMDMQNCGRGVVYSAGDPSFGFLNVDGQARILQSPVTADMRGKLGDAFQMSSDASRVRFGLGLADAQPVLFDLAAGALVDSPGVPGGFVPPRTDGLPVTDWNDNFHPAFDGTPVSIDSESRSIAIRWDRKGFVLGDDNSLHAFDANGRPRWTVPLPSVVWGANLTPSGDIIVIACFDGTIRWLRWEDGKELLALFVDVKDKRWVAWTPTGYYMASPGGEDLIGWHINRGWEQEADFFPASRFRDKFSRPDIVRLVLKTMDEGKAVNQANVAAHRQAPRAQLIENLPPVIQIASPGEGSTAAAGPLEIRYGTRVPSGGSVDRVEVLVDGARSDMRGPGPAPGPDGTGIVTVAMPAHDVTISLIAYAGGKASDAARLVLKGQAPAPADQSNALLVNQSETLKPTLYALLIGVSHYDNASYDLGYSAADAQGMADALLSQKGRLYKDVVVRVLIDKDATEKGIKLGLAWLGKQATARDLAIVFAAGHGTTDAEGKFWFLPSDMDPDAIDATGVSQDEIRSMLFKLPGKKLLFLDACHSGAALDVATRGLARGGSDLTAAVNDFAQSEGGVVAYSASTGRELSQESATWGMAPSPRR